MKTVIFNDGRQMTVQKMVANGGVLHLRMILQTSDQLKAFFQDKFATAKMRELENGKELSVHEGYTVLSYIKEEAGGIWEVEMLQPEADLNTRITELEVQAQNNAQVLEQAIVELTMMIASFGQKNDDAEGEEKYV